MDPNANLREQAELLADMSRPLRAAQAVPGYVYDRDDYRADRARLAELRAALTDWLNRGGFAPEWNRYPSAARYYGISVPFGGMVGVDHRYKAAR